MHLRTLVTLALLAAATDLPAQSGSSAEQALGAPVLEAARLDGSLQIDGFLDEAEWAAASVSSDFTESFPAAGQPASERTELRVLYDEQAIYVGLRMFDSSPDSIAAPLARRDANGIYSDWIHVILDSFHDRRTAFRFTANPRGVQRDVYTYNDGNEDTSWDAVWQVATQIDSLGWTAEYRIPLSQLRFHGEDEAGERVWGLQVMRDIARREQRFSWAPWEPQSPGFVSYFGELHGLAGIEPARRLEVQPYASTRLTRAPADTGNPFYEPNAANADFGADVKVGLTSGLTLTGTVNPDFGQVEQDPATINLSAFESFFSERRPFFVEGADVFEFGQIRANMTLDGQTFFYSRRIGRSPQRLLRGSEFSHIDAPGETTILGAAKVTGKVGDWTLGVMDAVTSHEDAAYMTPTGELLQTPVEPRTNYFLSRVRRDFRNGGTAAGTMFSTVHRDLDSGVFDGLLRSSAYFGGADFDHAWANRTWRLSGFVAASRVEGDPTAIERTQRSPGRYYQRPDADYVALDPTRTSLNGYIGQVALQRSGDWDMSLSFKDSSPGFELNDAGFQGRTDYRDATGFLGRRVNEPGSLFRSYSYYGFGGVRWNHGGERLLTLIGGGVNGSLQNLWNFGGSMNVQPGAYDDRLTRGGPLAARPAQWNANADFGTPSRNRVSLQGSANLNGDTEGRYSRSVSLSTDWRPSAAVRVQVGPSVSWSHGVSQYVGTFADERAAETFGSRYVFADIDQTTVSMTTRLDWTFAPTLSLQLYAQPFIATGDYAGFKEFTRPREFDFDVYGSDRGTICAYGGRLHVNPVAARSCPAEQSASGEDGFDLAFNNPDFNVRSLRGNAVLRWEYRPGSALFLVWQQQRSGFLGDGQFSFRRDVDAIFEDPSTNVFMIKATYWFGG